MNTARAQSSLTERRESLRDRQVQKRKSSRSIANESRSDGGSYSEYIFESPVMQQQRDLIQSVENSYQEPNLTGLPDQMKSNFENYSGYDLGDVRVIYNSDKPAQLQANAYAQGSEIHVGPGHEKHLGHELWHVVQQKQGRVEPTMQLKGGVNINEDHELEKEAEVLGTRAMNTKTRQSASQTSNSISEYPIQRYVTKGDGGQEYDSFQRLLNEFSKSVQSAIEGNALLAEELKAMISADQRVPIDIVMKTIVKMIGKISSKDCQDIRFDPVADKWLVPDDDELWDTFIQGYERSGGKMKMSFEEFEARKIKKAEQEEASKIPIDVSDSDQLKRLWGPSLKIDPKERVPAIIKMFTEVGIKVSQPVVSDRSSSDTPPTLFDVEHPMISKFEIHPGGGIHKAPYIRISTNIGMIKIIHSGSYPAYDRLDEKNVIYIEL